MVKYAIVVFVLGCAGLQVECRKLPSYIEVCHRSDPNLNECLKRNVETIQPKMVKGIPQLHIPSFDPLVFDKFTFVDSDNFKFTAKDIRAYHVDEFVMKDIAMDVERNTLNLTLNFPFVHMELHYFLKGDLMIFNFDAEGEQTSNYTNILATAWIEFEKMSRNGKTHFRISKTSTSIEVERFELNFEGVFSDARLNAEFNKFLNENIDNFFDTIKPVASKFTFHQIFKTINTVLNLYSYDELFPE